jgi:hypothetical protein
MSNLKNEVAASTAVLQTAWQKLSNRTPSTLLPTGCYVVAWLQQKRCASITNKIPS